MSFILKARTPSALPSQLSQNEPEIQGTSGRFFCDFTVVKNGSVFTKTLPQILDFGFSPAGDVQSEPL